MSDFWRKLGGSATCCCWGLRGWAASTDWVAPPECVEQRSPKHFFATHAAGPVSGLWHQQDVTFGMLRRRTLPAQRGGRGAALAPARSGR